MNENNGHLDMFTLKSAPGKKKINENLSDLWQHKKKTCKQKYEFHLPTGHFRHFMRHGVIA